MFRREMGSKRGRVPPKGRLDMYDSLRILHVQRKLSDIKYIYLLFFRIGVKGYKYIKFVPAFYALSLPFKIYILNFGNYYFLIS